MINATTPFSKQSFGPFIVFVCVLFALFFAADSQSSPGAHGPNGEHLDVYPRSLQAQRPRFEAFTESFELLGEIFEDELIIYLHDFKTNAPIAEAEIEIESATRRAFAVFDREQNRYVLKNKDLLSIIKQAGEHQIVATILTDNNDDLLLANLTIPTSQLKTNEHNNEHRHFPWWTVGITIGALFAGFFLGRRNSKDRS
jgi:hypothetical protein